MIDHMLPNKAILDDYRLFFKPFFVDETVRHVARGGSVGSDELPSQIKGPLFQRKGPLF